MGLIIVSKSVNEETGSGEILIEGDFPVPKRFDDPIVELFRPIRAKYRDLVLFTIYVVRGKGQIKCVLYPSNMKKFSSENFFNTATNLLRYMIIDEYEALLDLFFEEESGVGLFNENIKNNDFAKCGEDIESFIRKAGYEMPSIKEELKKIEEANKKTRN